MPDALQTVLIYAAIPVAATFMGGILPLLYTPGPRVRSSIQHFAAGLVFAAVAVELLPEITAKHDLLSLVAGFLAGVILMLSIKWFSEGRGKKKVNEDDKSRSLVLAAGVDYLVDGLLVGIGFGLSAKAGGLLTFALSIEGAFLALAVTSELVRQDVRSSRLVAIAAVFGVLFGLGAIASAVLFGILSGSAHTVMLAFGAAALIYLVTEELLVEAHEHRIPENPFIAALFFVGFLLMVGIEMSIQ